MVSGVLLHYRDLLTYNPPPIIFASFGVSRAYALLGRPILLLHCFLVLLEYYLLELLVPFQSRALIHRAASKSQNLGECSRRHIPLSAAASIPGEMRAVAG